MPSAVAVITGLKFNGTDLQDANLRIFLQIVSGGPDASPETRGGDRTIPYRRGQIYGPKRADKLTTMLEGWVAGQGSTEADQRDDTAAARQELFALFDVEGGEGTLEATTEDGTAWQLNCYPDLFVPDYQPQVPTHVGVSVRLIAIDPPNWVAGGS